MSELYFNELSLDSNFSNLPVTKNQAKQLVFDLVKTALAYVLSKGTSDVAVLSVNNKISDFTLCNHLNIFPLLTELFQEERLSENERNRFRALVNKYSPTETNPEYSYKNNEVSGISKAISEEKYVISFKTHEDWNNSSISNIKKNDGSNYAVNNISNLKHVFIHHCIYNSCEYTNTKPKEDFFLPKSMQSEYIPLAYDCYDWNDFYYKYRKNLIDRTQCLHIAKTVAKVNGWEYLGMKRDNQGTNRHTFKAKKYYLQVDTEKGAFEVYNGTQNHLGEILFNTNKVKKPKTSRSIRL